MSYFLKIIRRIKTNSGRSNITLVGPTFANALPRLVLVDFVLVSLAIQNFFHLEIIQIFSYNSSLQFVVFN